ncbi:MAG: gliding motility-associated C-terminal domain-containing protein [Sphingobacteriales bacterium]|nr:MAG: gliding motility-associated C-terminal domain-containing protein [Sphingobacteriales bacterium]
MLHMFTRRRIFQALFSLLLIFIFGRSQTANACHTASGYIYVNYVGAGIDGCSGTTDYKYEIHLILYTACQGCQFPIRDSAQIQWESRDGSVPGGNVWVHELTFDTVSQICPGFKKRGSCDSLANAEKFPAYMRTEFVSLPVNFLSLPGPRTDWVFSYNTGARPNPVNINGGGTLYIEAMLNNLNKYNKSTPRFTSDPLRYLCVNQPNMFLNGPFDPNGDSMVVTTINPKGGPLPANEIPYLAALGYSTADPIGSDASNPYALNPVTGLATFTPKTTGMFQLTYQINSYERGTGILLANTMRDINIQVLSCSEPPPPVDSTPSTIANGTFIQTKDGKMVYTCPGNTLKFEVASQAKLPSSQLYLSARADQMAKMNGAVFNAPQNGSSAVTGTFEWTPTVADIGDYQVEITSKDSTCTGGSGYTIMQMNTTTYIIRVTPGLELGPDIPICAINNSPKQLFAKNGEYLKLKWEEITNGVVMPGAPAFLSNPTIQNPIANPNRDITYRVSSTDLTGNCKSSDDITLKIDSSTMVDAFPDNPVIMCKPDYLQLDARLTGDKPTGNIGCGTLKLVQALERDTVEIIGSGAYGTLAVYDTVGPTTPVIPNDVKTAKMEYLIQKDEIMTANMRSGTIKNIALEIVESNAPVPQLYRNFTIKMKCTNLKSLNAAAGFQNDNTMTTVFSSVAPVTFAAGSTQYFELDQPYSWDTMQNILIQICYSNTDHQVTCLNPKGYSPTMRFVPTEKVSTLFYKAPDTIIKDICPIRTDANIKEFTTRPKIRFGYSEAAPEDYQIRWTGSLISDSTIQTPLAYIPRSMTYYVQTYGRSGCIIRDSVEIYVPVRDYKILPGDTAVCYGADAVLKIDKGFHYKWYEYVDGQYRVPAPSTISCVNCREVRVRPLVSTTYRIVIYDSVWCTDTIEARVKVLPLPIVKLLNKDTIIRYGASIPLLATGARQYNWLPSGSLSTPNTSATIATPSERTQYVVMGIGANGCRSYDTVVVDVNKRENVFVPTAFSPNGDGKNDVFRVANMTFQGLMEFRVFNRWGQEIFSTTNAKGGWDGNWNGEPQPVGNYRYIIKVGYPDGHNETYTGDVTLVR